MKGGVWGKNRPNTRREGEKDRGRGGEKPNKVKNPGQRCLVWET